MSPFNEHALEMGIMELFEQQGYSYQRNGHHGTVRAARVQLPERRDDP